MKRVYPRRVLRVYPLYASGESCLMCDAAIFWSGIGRVVFGISSRAVYEMAGNPPDQLRLSIYRPVQTQA